MIKSRRFFYISIFLIILSLFLSAQNPLIATMFGSILSLVLISSILNGLILFISVFTIDKAIKYKVRGQKGFSKFAKVLPIILFLVLIYHISVLIKFFGIV